MSSFPKFPTYPTVRGWTSRIRSTSAGSADLAGIPRDALRALNPAFNRWATLPDGHRLLGPAPAEARFERVFATLPPRARLRLRHHSVGRGDTLSAIARRNGIPLEACVR